MNHECPGMAIIHLNQQSQNTKSKYHTPGLRIGYYKKLSEIFILRHDRNEATQRAPRAHLTCRRSGYD